MLEAPMSATVTLTGGVAVAFLELRAAVEAHSEAVMRLHWTSPELRALADRVYVARCRLEFVLA